LSADKDQQESCAVAGKPQDAVVKFDTYDIYSGIVRFSLRQHGFVVLWTLWYDFPSCSYFS